VRFAAVVFIGVGATGGIGVGSVGRIWIGWLGGCERRVVVGSGLLGDGIRVFGGGGVVGTAAKELGAIVECLLWGVSLVLPLCYLSFHYSKLQTSNTHHGICGVQRTKSSFAPFMLLKLARYSSSSALNVFTRSNAFSCFVCTGSCFASLE
jgi:hypothetical protein